MWALLIKLISQFLFPTEAYSMTKNVLNGEKPAG